jgi:hypothetical protein
MVRSRARWIVPAALVLLATWSEAPAATSTSPAKRAAYPAGEVLFEGRFDAVAHYARPGETRRYELLVRSFSDGRGAVRSDWTIWSEGDTSRVPETFLLAGGRIFHRSKSGERWSELSGMKGEQGRLQATAAFLGSRRGPDPESTVVLRAHPRLGDVRDRVVFTYPKPGIVDLTMAVHELHHEWTLQARLTSERPLSSPESLFAVPADTDTAPANPDSLQGEAVLQQVAEGVWSLSMEDIESRSLVVEFADHLAVIEVALNSANGERIVDTVKRKWPSKPIRYVLFSHHHPHYLGGIRALLAEGATVVTTPGNEAYVRRIAEYPFTLRPDRLAKAPRPVQVLPFPARIELSDSTNRLVAFNIGKRSNHTDEFVLFWLPRQRVLFEAEQGWVTVNDTLRAARRAPTFLEIVKEENMDADLLVQSWPMKGEPAVVPRRDLEALVAKRKK